MEKDTKRTCLKKKGYFLLKWVCRELRLLGRNCAIVTESPRLCLSGCKWLFRGGLRLRDGDHRQEVSHMGIHAPEYLLYHWSDVGGFGELSGEAMVALSDHPVHSDCALYPVLLDASRNSLLASLRRKIQRSTRYSGRHGCVE